MEEKNNDDIEKLPKEEEKLINSQSIHNFEQIDNSTNMTQAPENEKTNTSSTDTKEDFEWIYCNKNRKLIENYSLFPLPYWKTITYDKLDKKKLLKPGTCYQSCVNSVLKIDIFKMQTFTKETMKYKAINDDYISPDFFVQNINLNTFNKIIKERKYMFKMNYKIPPHIKKINVIGEIKTSKSGLKKGNQKGDYLKFAEAKSDSRTLYVVMYIFDNSYKEFFSSRITDKNPVIYGYVPKLYKEDCYDNYYYVKTWLIDEIAKNQKNYDYVVKEFLKKKEESSIRAQANDNITKKIFIISITLNIILIIILIIIIIFK